MGTIFYFLEIIIVIKLYTVLPINIAISQVKASLCSGNKYSPDLKNNAESLLSLIKCQAEGWLGAVLHIPHMLTWSKGLLAVPSMTSQGYTGEKGAQQCSYTDYVVACSTIQNSALFIASQQPHVRSSHFKG